MKHLLKLATLGIIGTLSFTSASFAALKVC